MAGAATSTRGFGGGGGGGAARFGAVAFGRSTAVRGAAFAWALPESSPAFTGEGRDFNPRRCALPITALRLTPPSSSAIWLAVSPFSQCLRSVSMRSSVHDIVARPIHFRVRLEQDCPNHTVAACADTAKPIVETQMNDQPKSPIAATSCSETPMRRFAEPGQAVIQRVNWGGLSALYVKEVRRFFKVQTQTIWAPAVTTLLYLVIFTVAMGTRRGEVLGTPFVNFLAPGLIAMAMLQNAFANSSFSLLVGKIQGTLVDYLMPPLSELELLLAMVGAAVTRAVMVGCAIWLVMQFWPGVSVVVHHPWAVIVFGLLGAAMLGFLGVLTSIWAEKFDHSAAITNFVVAPMALLSGTFYSVDKLIPVFAHISHFNPFFYMISGFRYGFIGQADSPVAFGALILLSVNIVLGGTCYALLRSGWKIKP